VNDQQVLTVAIAIVFPLSMPIYSNSHMSEAKETLRAEMALGFERLSNKIDHLAGEAATSGSGTGLGAPRHGRPQGDARPTWRPLCPMMTRTEPAPNASPISGFRGGSMFLAGASRRTAGFAWRISSRSGPSKSGRNEPAR